MIDIFNTQKLIGMTEAEATAYIASNCEDVRLRVISNDGVKQFNGQKDSTHGFINLVIEEGFITKYFIT